MPDRTYRERRGGGQVFVTIREDGFVIGTWLPDADRDWPGVQVTSRDDAELGTFLEPADAADYVYERFAESS